MDDKQDALAFLQEQLTKKEKRTMLNFKEYLNLAEEDPCHIFRNIFQVFYDMVNEYVSVEDDEYADDPESIGFVKYDCSKLFIEGADNPFFADTPFANRFVRQIENLRQGFQQNRVYVYEGPSGCGKSTFLNNLLRSFEMYTRTPEGQTFEIVWEIDESVFDSEAGQDTKPLFIPCPSHDYPILIIPKSYRAQFLSNLLSKAPEIKERIFRDREYAWIFYGEACTICKSIFASIFERLGSIDKVLDMLKVRTYRFDRRIGEGISVFSPGDKPFGGIVKKQYDSGYFFTDKKIQERLDKIFGINVVRYIFSSLAKTNNGIYVLMDVKSYNIGRLLDLHNVISEGVHKVGNIEENIHSLFFALMNPEDKSVIEDEKMESFRGRIQYNHISYVLEPMAEANIYRNIFGKSIDERFLPRILENFARVVISSRMNTECLPQQDWVQDMKKYKLYCDRDGLLLRMELYRNNIPVWLSEEDRKNFTAPIRRAIIAEGQNEGNKGFSGRDSIALFGDFFSRYGDRQALINMNNLVEFFKRDISKKSRDEHIPKNFLASLVDSYDYMVLNEVKEALYFYNKEQVSRDILNYFCVINYDVGDTVQCTHTGKEIEVTIDFLKLMVSRITGKDAKEEEALLFARETQKKYITIIAGKDIEIIQTDLYKDFLNACMRNLKDKVLQPFIKNKNFREAIKAFGTEKFDVFDTRLKEHVSHMITSLTQTFNYSQQGAKEICIYVLDNNLVNKFSFDKIIKEE